jgi:hypothetical protein
METMRQEGLTHVPTNDRPFEQEGFKRAVSPIALLGFGMKMPLGMPVSC